MPGIKRSMSTHKQTIIRGGHRLYLLGKHAYKNGAEGLKKSVHKKGGLARISKVKDGYLVYGQKYDHGFGKFVK